MVVSGGFASDWLENAVSSLCCVCLFSAYRTISLFRRLVFQACTSKMNLHEEVDLEDYVSRPDKINAAQISSICQEAGLQAVRHNRYVIMPKDFEVGYKRNTKKTDVDFDFYT